jgi:hypothetical protein
MTRDLEVLRDWLWEASDALEYREHGRLLAPGHGNHELSGVVSNAVANMEMLYWNGLSDET